jgi:ABC-type uncharacterized transport system ATPase subunit
MGGAQIVLLSKDGNEGKLKTMKIGFKTVNDHIYIGVTDGSVRDTLNKMIAQNVNLDEMVITQPTLEDVFIKLTGTAIREEAAGPMEHLRMVRRVRGKNR